MSVSLIFRWLILPSTNIEIKLNFIAIFKQLIYITHCSHFFLNFLCGEFFGLSLSHLYRFSFARLFLITNLIVIHII